LQQFASFRVVSDLSSSGTRAPDWLRLVGDIWYAGYEAALRR